MPHGTGVITSLAMLADPRVRRRSQLGLHGRGLQVRPVFYRLRDEPHAIILVACSKCDWKAAFERDVLITSHGPDVNMVELLGTLAAPGCPKVGHHWDRCGAYYVDPIDAQKGL
jgi:hypothetical protein